MINYTDITIKDDKLAASDIKKLPTAEKNKTILIDLINQPFTDRNTVRAINEVRRQIKINKKKYPTKKTEIEKYFHNLLDLFFDFEIGTHDLLERCKMFSIVANNEENKNNDKNIIHYDASNNYNKTCNDDGGMGLA